MDIKTCSMCNIEKHINTFYKKCSECKDCNRARGLERYNENRAETSKQQKYMMKKNREKNLIQKQKIRCIQIRDLVKSYVDL